MGACVGDAQALQALARLVEAGAAVPVEVQAAANQAIARAVARWRLPAKGSPGRPPKHPADAKREARAAVLWLWLRNGAPGIPAAERGAIIGRHLNLSAGTVERYFERYASQARELWEAAQEAKRDGLPPHHNLELWALDAEVSAIREAEAALLLFEFEDLREGAPDRNRFVFPVGFPP